LTTIGRCATRATRPNNTNLLLRVLIAVLVRIIFTAPCLFLQVELLHGLLVIAMPLLLMLLVTVTVVVVVLVMLMMNIT